MSRYDMLTFSGVGWGNLLALPWAFKQRGESGWVEPTVLPILGGRRADRLTVVLHDGREVGRIICQPLGK